MKIFTYPIDIASGTSASKNEKIRFDDYNHIDSVCWVGNKDLSTNIEIRKHDGKEVFVDSVPLQYLAIGDGREELILDQAITDNSIRIALESDGTTAVKGCLVFTLDK